ncbi:MAG: diguanylate cyclase domain-containing protein [Marinobacterium sp.]
MVRNLLRTGPPPAIAYSLIMLLVALSLLLGEYVVGLVQQRVEQINRVEAVAVLAQKRAELESRINSVLYLSSSLSTFIAVNPHSDSERWHALSQEILREAPLVRNIGLAPDNVMRFVYPLSGNEQALGLDYRQLPAQWPAVEAAMISGRMTLAGPVNLVQGGRGLIARSPIYFEQGGRRHYWGLSSVVIDFDELMRETGLGQEGGAFRISIRGRDGKGRDGDIFIGQNDVFQKPLAQMPVYFPNGSWVMAAVPRDELITSVMIFRLVAWGLVAVLGAAASVMYQLYRFALSQSLTDSLTGCANRRSLLHRTQQLAELYPRTGRGFSVLFVDLNHFKQVNDTYGHHVGDLLLVEAAARLNQHVRRSDTLARNGGDEFILLLPGMQRHHAGKLSAKLEALMEQPFVLTGLEIHISASVGCAVFPDEAGTADELINLADSRMYNRKRKKKAEKAVCLNGREAES